MQSSSQVTTVCRKSIYFCPSHSISSFVLMEKTADWSNERRGRHSQHLLLTSSCTATLSLLLLHQRYHSYICYLFPNTVLSTVLCSRMVIVVDWGMSIKESNKRYQTRKWRGERRKLILTFSYFLVKEEEEEWSYRSMTVNEGKWDEEEEMQRMKERRKEKHFDGHFMRSIS